MKSFAILSLSAVMALVLAGCTGVTAPGEKQARQNLGQVAGQYRPSRQRPALPELTPNSGLTNFIAFSLLNSPSVEAAFYDWSASVEQITVTRSLPDPQLVLQAYIQDRLTSLMPGFAWSIPGAGKLKARAGVAVAESQGKYFAFESAMLNTAFNLERAYYQLGLLGEQIGLKREKLSLLENQERAVRSQNESGEASLAGLLNLQSDLDRDRNELANLEDSRRSALENFKGALGLTSEQKDPPVPARFESDAADPDAEALLRAAFAGNPGLKAMEVDVRAAEAGIAVAYKERSPDFNVALMADVKASPVLFWPQTGMSLPIWRDKIAAEIAQAKATELAAKSRLQAGQIDLAVSFAEKSFACRETGRNLALIENELIPRAQASLENANAGYRAGAADFASLIQLERVLLDLKLEAAEDRAAHEIALADLSLTVAGVPPVNTPLLRNTTQP